MKTSLCARRNPREVFPRRPAATVSLLLSCALLAHFPAAFAAARAGAAAQGGQSRGSKPEPPRPGAPEGSLPNLDGVRGRPAAAPHVPAPIPSTVRSRRKPLEPRRGRKVGDPLPPPSRAAGPVTGQGSFYAFFIPAFLLSSSFRLIQPVADYFSIYSGENLAAPAYAGERVVDRFAGGATSATLLQAQGGTNLALGKPATQSTTLAYNPPGDAWHAVDGNTDGNYFHGSVTHTAGDAKPWWQVDLGAIHSVTRVELWNRTDCCSDRLSNFYVFVSDVPFASNDPAATQAQAGVWTAHTPGQSPASLSLPVNHTGRYVRVQLAGSGILSLAEVRVLGSPLADMAGGKAAAQSSVALSAAAGRAVDGNTGGDFYAGSVTHTFYENQPWWQVDIGSVQRVDAVRLWNRTDCCSDRLSNFYVFVSDVPFASAALGATLAQSGVSAYYAAGQAGAITEVPVGRSGRYVRVQLAGANVLSLAEVQVLRALTPEESGTPYGGTPVPIPGTIQAEGFDLGGEGVAYHDQTAANEGGQYRPGEGVDIGGNASGYNVGWTLPGEWMKYGVNVTRTDDYRPQAVVSTVIDSAALHIEVDGVNVTGTIQLPNTYGYGVWQTVSGPWVRIAAGRHELKMVVESGHFLIDSIRVVPPAPAAPAGLTAAAVSTARIDLTWADNSSNETGFLVERREGAVGAYAQVASVGAGATSYADAGLRSNTQYNYRVRATNLGGESGYSNEAGVRTLNVPPAVSLTAPINGAGFTAPACVTLNASASDADGTVVKVEFFSGATLLATDTSAPYEYTQCNLGAGGYTLTARATDEAGAQATSEAVGVTVTLPTVSVTAGDAVASEQGTDVGSFTVSRTGSTGSPLTVNYTVGGTAAAGADYVALSGSVTIPAAAASQVLTVTPVDDALIEAGGETVTLTVSADAAYAVGTPAAAALTIADNDTYPPAVTITAPGAGATFMAPANVTLQAAASDTDGQVVKVEFFRDGGKVCEDVSAPYGCEWNGIPAGGYTLTARATDNMGATGDSAPVSVNVNAGNRPPSAQAGGPYGGAVGQNILFDARGSNDPDGTVAGYAWDFGDGSTGSGVSPTHAYASPGSYSVALTVTDNLGAQASAGTTVSVSSASADQFVAHFLQWGLGRQPGNETSYWADITRAASPRGQTVMLPAMRELGMTVFESAEYAARNRSDHWYVYDLYQTYLMRDPDQEGWEWWESRVPLMGREQLRQAFDESIEFRNIVAALGAGGAPSESVSSLSAARLDPFNQTGDPVRARDSEWGVTLVSLPGRAGLDLGLSLSYSSLVWTRSGPYAYFDEDRGSPSPGFRLGFASIRGPFFDARAGRNVYVLVTSSGRRVGLRQVGASNVYEAADSSYLQLFAGAGGLLLRSPDGTRMSFAPFANGWQATAMEDRNGNLLSVSYDWRGDIATITDTLGRTLTFNYDGNANLNTITQSRRVNGAAQAHTWASFGWGTATLQPGFGLAAVGAEAGEVIPVLTQVGLGDGSRYTFGYTGAGQVNVIRRYTQDNVERSRVSYDYETPADDCPRVTNQRVWAYDWNGVNDVPAEVLTQFADEGGSHAMTAPDGTVYRDFYGAGWLKGLVTRSEVVSGGALRKWTTTQWTQDDTGVSYQTNPRVTETNVYDEGGNRRRTTVDYGRYAHYGLPYLVTEYAADGTTELRRTYTDYNLAQGYIDAHIIGLVSATHVYDSAAGKWLAKTTYAYDEAGSVTAQATTAPGHDPSYDSSFLTRGDVTSVSRWDVEDIVNASKALTSRMSYDAAGSVVSSKDAAGHETTAVYADSFSDGENTRGTYAYPTRLTDADGFSSSFQYDYDFGARTRAAGPPPAGQTAGLVQTFSYDGAARLLRVTTENTGAYVRFVYGANYVQQFSTVNSVADEAYAVRGFDGLGRVTGEAWNLPNSVGGYGARLTRYDEMGRAAKLSNPTEVDESWVPSGDDAAGWVYTRQSYDWKGRPRITTNTDGTQKSASYEGCGCAGGEVVTMTDEAGRRRKVYGDALGRRWKTEVLNPNGSVYSTTTNAFNARDQVTLMRWYQGAEQSGVYQETVIGYDGHGRIQSRHTPRQNAGRSTVYSYADDDTVASVTDARGAKTTYAYNGRHQVTSIGYDLSGVMPGQDVAPTPNVSFAYGGAGQRILMTDGLGAVNYTFDDLGRLTSEKRTLSDPNNTQVNGLERALAYDYNLAGELKFVRDPFGAQVDYQYDAAGQPKGVTGTLYGNVSTYASDMQYRAWGALKGLSYGNGRALSLGYNTRMQVEHYNIPGVLNNQYRYTTAPTGNDNDGRVKFVQDLTQASSRFDRAYRYDHVGRLTESLTGSEARGGNLGDGPYRETYGFDVWGQSTSLVRRAWGTEVDSALPVDGATGRTSAWTYDADGRVTADDEGRTFRYDAAGRLASTTYPVRVGNVTQTRTRHRGYDGDGYALKVSAFVGINYRLRSTPLGGWELSVLDAAGQKSSTNVYAAGGLLAVQAGGGVRWQHQTPFGTTERETDASGAEVARAELNPTGADFGVQPPQGPEPLPAPDLVAQRYGDPLATTSYMVDGVAMPSLRVNMFAFSLAARGHLPAALGGTGGVNVTAADYAWAQGADTEEITSGGGATLDEEGNPVLRGAEVTVRAGYYVLAAGTTTTLHTKLVIQTSVPCAVDTQLPAEGTGYIIKSGTSRKSQYGTSTTISSLQNLALTWALSDAIARLGNADFSLDADFTVSVKVPPSILQPLRVGDIGRLGGGQFPPHKGTGHPAGTGVDIGLFRIDGKNLGGDYRGPFYDQATTRQFIDLLDSDPNVVDYYFNDPDVTGVKLKRVAGHDNHVHVNFTPCVR